MRSLGLFPFERVDHFLIQLSLIFNKTVNLYVALVDQARLDRDYIRFLVRQAPIHLTLYQRAETERATTKIQK